MFCAISLLYICLALINSVAAQSTTANATPEFSNPLVAYIGTFSSPLKDTLPTQVDLPPGNGRGIHIFYVDRQSGALMPQGTVELGNSPSCLAINAAGTRLYSANETDRIGPNKVGSVSSFEINPITGMLQFLNTQEVGSQGPTYVSLYPDGRWLFTANYFGGSVTVLPIKKEGEVGPKIHVLSDLGTIGPTVATNAPPGSFAFSGHDRTHAHMIQPDPQGKYILHVDLAIDKISVNKFDSESGILTPHTDVALPPGDGPRHFHFHPNGKWFYSIQEEGSNVVLFDYDAGAGKLTARQTISTLPKGFKGSNFCSEILVSYDGKFVYAGNRLYDSIAIFAVQDDGQLVYVGEQWTRGNYPRSFSFDPTGNFLFCCNQRADNVAVFRVNRETGQLEFTGHFAAVGNPSHIVFLDLQKK
jgi:6-phosphogluconolactonase